MGSTERLTDPAYIAGLTRNGYEDQLQRDFELVIDSLVEVRPVTAPLDEIFLVTTAQRRFAQAQAEYEYPDPLPIEGVSPTLGSSVRIVRAITDLYSYMRDSRAQTEDNGLAVREGALRNAVALELGVVRVQHSPGKSMSAAEMAVELKLREELGISRHPATPLPPVAQFLMDNFIEADKF